MTSEPQGLTPDETRLACEALEDLPRLLAEAHEGGRLTGDTGRSGTRVPGPRTPTDLTMMAAAQTLTHAWTAVEDRMLEAGQDPPTSHDPAAALAATLDWWAPCWWARDEAFIPVREARTALRRMLAYTDQPRYLCPKCGETMHLQPGGRHFYCAAGHQVHATSIAEMRRRPPMATDRICQEFGIRPERLWTWKNRGKLDPVDPHEKPLRWFPWDVLRCINPDLVESIEGAA